MFKRDITIYNQLIKDKKTQLQSTVLVGVHYENVEGVIIGSTSVSSSNSTEIVIPLSIKGFIKPKQYNGDGWTLAPNDFVMLGTTDIEVNDVRDLEKLDDVRTIQSYDVIDYATDTSLNNITVVAK